jgi:hypothetical protein
VSVREIAVDHVGADESGAAGHENAHVLALSFLWGALADDNRCRARSDQVHPKSWSARYPAHTQARPPTLLRAT